MCPFNNEQNKALDISRDIIVSAGAGSGKTRVLTERYFRLFTEHNDLTVDQVAAITFTEKAAAKLVESITERLAKESSATADPALRARFNTLRRELGGAWIGTIHSFCRKILAEHPFEAGVDVSFTILDEAQSMRFRREAIEAVLDRCTRNSCEDLCRHVRTLIKCLGGAQMRAMIHLLISKRDLVEPHIRKIIKSTPDDIARSDIDAAQSMLPNTEIDQALELAHAGVKTALAGLFVEVLKEYEALKGNGSALDFDDLLIRAHDLLAHFPDILGKLQGQFRHILIDEFQDTDPLQWRIFKMLSQKGGPGSLFLVGDPKQSIYGFRRADVRLFNEGRRYIEERNQKSEAMSRREGEDADDLTGVIPMTTNYRSSPNILDFVNHLFSRLMKAKDDDMETGYEVHYEALKSGKEQEPGDVVFLHADVTGMEDSDGSTNDEGKPTVDVAIPAEAQLIARYIQNMMATNSPEGIRYGDMAILLRTRGHLKEYEEALFLHRIPYMTIGGLGFYDRPEIGDMINLMEFLLSPENDPCLLALLRSPFLRISDEIIYKTAVSGIGSLWSRLQNAAGKDQPCGEAADSIRKTTNLLQSLMDLSHKIPLTKLLQEFLTLTGGWALLAYGSEGIRKRENIEKFLRLARDYDTAGFHALSEYLTDIRSSVGEEQKEAEAILPTEGVNAVQIMTIHQAKGLEFNVVILPGMADGFNTRINPPLLIHDDFGLAMRIMDPADKYDTRENALFAALRALENSKRGCEEKRIFYVGATRAIQRLVLCTRKTANKRDSRQTWLTDHIHYPNNPENNQHLNLIEQVHEYHIPIITQIELPINILNNESAASMSERGAHEGRSPDMFAVSLRLADAIPHDPHRRGIYVTRLMEFASCPIYYYLHYIAGWSSETLKEMGIGLYPQTSDKPSARSAATAFGKAIHKLLEMYPPAAGAMTKEEIVSLTLDDESSLSSEERSALKEEILKVWDRIQTKPFMKILDDAAERLEERKFQICLERHVLAGRVDLLYRDKSGFWSVIDYKTGRVFPGSLTIKAERYRLQMDAYGVFLSRFAPEQDHWDVTLAFVEEGEHFTKQYTRQSLASTIQNLVALMDQEDAFHKAMTRPVNAAPAQPTAMFDEHCPKCDRSKLAECTFRSSVEKMLAIEQA